MTSSVYFLRIVPHLDSSHSLVFPVMEYTLQDATVLKMGRTTDKRHSPVHMTFRSKVVSRRHAEIWIEQGKVKSCLYKEKLPSFIQKPAISFTFVIPNLLQVHL
jgi:hypothetical protein